MTPAELAIAREHRPALSPTPLQIVLAAFAAAVAQLEQLEDRQRAVALDIAQRRLAKALVEHAALLHEWDLAA